MKTILVTGAAGTVGNYVVSLAETAGYRVIATDRSATGVRTPVRGEVRIGDLKDHTFCQEVVKGCEGIIHTAAELDVAANTAELSAINTQAVIQLYEAATQAKAQRFVQISTAMLYDANLSGPINEQAAVAPRGAYGLSKQGAEFFLQGMGERQDRPAWTLVRCAPIYGRRGRHFAASLLAIGPILRLGLPFLPGFRGGPRANLVHAEDVARALLFLLEKEVSAYQIFNLADDDPLPLGERITQTFQAYGLRTLPFGNWFPDVLEKAGRLFQTPGAYQSADVALLAAWRLVIARHRLKAALRPQIDREAWTLLYSNLVLDTSKIQSLGFRPRFSTFSEGWQDVLSWYQSENWVPRYT